MQLPQDCSYYIVSLGVLAAFVSDQYVKPWEVGLQLCKVTNSPLSTKIVRLAFYLECTFSMCCSCL